MSAAPSVRRLGATGRYFEGLVYGLFGLYPLRASGVLCPASSPLCPVIPGVGGDDVVMTTIARTWIVTVEQARAVATLANSLGVSHSAMVRYLLQRALDGVKSGSIPIKTHPVRWALDGDD